MRQGKTRFVDNPVISKTTGKRVIHITRSVHDENGSVFAMIAGVINVDILVQPIKNVNVPRSIWIFLIAHNGDVIYHPVSVEGGNFITGAGAGHDDLAAISRRMVDGESGHAWIASYTGSKQDLLVYTGIAQGNADLTQRISINSNNEIGQVVGASSDASNTFSLVSRELSETEKLVMQIRTAMEEQNDGSKQILESLKMMNNSTDEVRSASIEMKEGNKLILSEVHNLQDATVQMTTSMDEMSRGARKINETGSVLSEVSERMKNSIEKIGKQIDEFKV